VLDTIKAQRRVAWILLSNASVVELAENLLTLRFPRPGDVKGFQSSGYEDLLKNVLVQRFGLHTMIKAISGGDPPPGRSAPRPGPAPQAGTPARQSPAAQSPAAQSPATADWPGTDAAAPGTPNGSGTQPPVAATANGAPGTGGDEAPWPTDPDPDPAPVTVSDESFAEDIPDETDMAAPPENLLTGMALIQRELGGEVIAEIDE
jgi:DNA polymerase-3 subunit gamma/tau